MNNLGRHILVDLYGCDRAVLDDQGGIEDCLNAAAVQAGATIVGSTFHHFSPHGVSGVVVIAESHLAIHTWPEYGYAALDIFTCGADMDPVVAFMCVKQSLRATDTTAQDLQRGIPAS